MYPLEPFVVPVKSVGFIVMCGLGLSLGDGIDSGGTIIAGTSFPVVGFNKKF